MKNRLVVAKRQREDGGEKEVRVGSNMKYLCSDGRMLYLDCRRYILTVRACYSLARWDRGISIAYNCM